MGETFENFTGALQSVHLLLPEQLIDEFGCEHAFNYVLEHLLRSLFVYVLGAEALF